MKSIIRLSIILLSGLMMMTTELHAEAGVSVLDKGTDGDIRYYSVICPSGKRTSLNFNLITKETCITPVNGNEQVCNVNWNKDKAAKEACK